MANPIHRLSSLSQVQHPPLIERPAAPGSADGQVSFQRLLLDSLSEASGMERVAQEAVEQSLTGEEITNVEVFSAVKKAELALSMMLQIRNKLLEAYDEIQQMQV